MSFAESEKRVDVLFHSSHLLCSIEDLNSCCKCSNHSMNNSTQTCSNQCDAYFSVCFKENSNSSEECNNITKPTDVNTTCYNTTEPTGGNTTLIPLTTPNIVQFMINSENMTLEVILLNFIYKIYLYI